MTKERLLQIAELVCDANALFEERGIKTFISVEVSQSPELCIYANWNGHDYENHYRYRASSPLLSDKLDPRFDAAEHRIRTLMEEAGRG